MAEGLDIREPELCLDGVAAMLPTGAGPTPPVLRDRLSVWHATGAVTESLTKLGGTTSYVILLEETMADNFALLASGRPACNAALLKRIEAVLLEPR